MAAFTTDDAKEDIELQDANHRQPNGTVFDTERHRYVDEEETSEEHGLLHDVELGSAVQSRRLFKSEGLGKRVAGGVLGGIGHTVARVRGIPATCKKLGFFGTMRGIFNFPEAGEELRSTAWLDGLRGLAAFQVFIFHYMDGWINHSLAYGTSEDGQGFVSPYWWYMPFFRTLYASGDASVCLFFAISGYVLSLRMLTLLRQQKHEQLLTSLSSAVFRRGIRLYMPVVLETFILMILCRWFNFPKPAQYRPAETFLLELRSWYVSLVHLLLPLRYPDRWDAIQDRYDGGISWTIPLEYYGSLFVYVIILLIARVQVIGVRRALIFAMVFSSFTKDDWIAAQFLMGMSFADYQLERKDRLSRQLVVTTGLWERWGRSLFFIGLALFGFYMSGIPAGHMIVEWDTDYRLWPRPYYDWLMKPIEWTGIYYQRQGDRYILCFATMCSLMGIGETPKLRRILETRIVQYLGRISFGLYLCHIFLRAWLESLGVGRSNVLWLVGLDPAIPYPNFPVSDSGKLFFAYVIMMIPATTVNFIGAGMFERYLDKPSVKAGRAFERWCLSWNEKAGKGVPPAQRPQPSIPTQEVGTIGTNGQRLE